jgi:hypothetical protein
MARDVLCGAMLGLWLTAASATAAEPAVPELLPWPTPLAPPAATIGAPEVYSAPVYPKRNPYDVWQYYGVDRRGVFRPRVIYSPYGSYYLYNGEPYPWAPTHPLDFMPYVVD